MAEKRINNTTYRVGRVTAPEALRMKVRIGKMLGPGLEDMVLAVAAGVSDDMDVKAKANAAVMSAVGMAFERCDPDAVVQLAGEIVAKSEWKAPSGDWTTTDFEGDMTERPADLYPLIGFVLKEALGAFFPAGAAGRLMGAKAH
ncbi:phage tail assembly chaperone [Tropicimonas sp. IMCC34011]|uniref:phage tail assembly chaperone n=1 Tax=Tropicimonas sp. IMCC34011 TaxID=2248759 RepID=UPI0018E580D3|nr:hypothetical protein [Tropicimonas sp. IMCC34011]